MSDASAPSSPPPEPPAEPNAGPATGGTSLEPHVAAAMACFFLLIGGIIFLVIEKKNQFVRFYAMQSVFLGCAWVALSIGLGIAGAMLHGIPLISTLLWLTSIAIRLLLFVVWVVLIVKAFSNKEWEIPYLGKLARQQLERRTSTVL